MDQNIIDLRQKPEPSSGERRVETRPQSLQPKSPARGLINPVRTSAPRSADESTASPLVLDASTTDRSQQRSNGVNWTTHEYEPFVRSREWFLAVGGAATILVVIGILLQSYFFVVFVILAFGVIMLYAKREPREIQCAITEEGIVTGRTFTPFSALKSFWIFKRRNDIFELSLETSRILLPYMIIPLENIPSDSVAKLLARFLPEKEYTESFTDQLMRNLGF